jgi:hypothetical protein
MRIDNVTIHVHAPAQQSSFLDALFKTAPPFATGGTIKKAAPASILTPPAIAQPWPGQGGIYAGIVRGAELGERDAHLILAADKPESDLAWQPALDWAKTVTADGHTDFALPTRFQSAVLYGNLRDQFETSGWYWTSTEFSERHAWIQYFNYGGQNTTGKSSEARARAVRLIHITT